MGDLMVIFMAALLDVPHELYEAAELDGAGAFKRFRYVTLPPISPILMFAVGHRRDPDDAVLHPADRRRAGRSGQIGGSGHQFEPGYPRGRR